MCIFVVWPVLFQRLCCGVYGDPMELSLPISFDLQIFPWDNNFLCSEWLRWILWMIDSYVFQRITLLSHNRWYWNIVKAEFKVTNLLIFSVLESSIGISAVILWNTFKNFRSFCCGSMLTFKNLPFCKIRSNKVKFGSHQWNWLELVHEPYISWSWFFIFLFATMC